MNLVEAMWQHVKDGRWERITFLPTRPTDLWDDLTAARLQTNAQSMEIGDLREAVNYLAAAVADLQQRLAAQEDAQSVEARELREDFTLLAERVQTLEERPTP